MMDEAEASAEHDAHELDRLVRFMTRQGRRFGLALVTYADSRIAEEQREHAVARAIARNRAVETLELCEASEDLVTALVEVGARNDVVFVIGLDELVYDLDGRSTPTRAITNLNLRRDELPELVAARVVVWISTEGYAQLAALAWDLVDVMFTRFELRGERPAKDGVEHPWAPQRPAWMQRAEAVDVRALEQQAKSMVRTATTAEDPETRMNAAQSAGKIYARLDRLDEAVAWILRAALIYDEAFAGVDESPWTLVDGFVGADLWRQLAELEFARGDESAARRHANRALELIPLEGGPRWLECLQTLAATEEPEPTDSLQVDDFELLDRWREGDRSAGSRLIARHFAYLHDYFQRFSIPASLVESHVREAFLVLFHSQPPPRDSVQFRSHLATIARFVLVEWVSQSPVPQIPPPRIPPPLEAALRRLSVEQQDLLELHYFHSHPPQELSRLFGVVEPAIQVRLMKALRTLARELSKQDAVEHDEQTTHALLVTAAAKAKAKAN